MAALEIRKDRTPTFLGTLAMAEADTRVARRILATATLSEACAGRRQPGRQAWTGRRCATGSCATMSTGSTASPTAGAMAGRPRSTRKSKPS